MSETPNLGLVRPFDPFLDANVRKLDTEVGVVRTFLAAPVLPIVATANLVAAGAAMDGKVVIEDTGTGTANLVVYKGGGMYRVALTLV